MQQRRMAFGLSLLALFVLALSLSRLVTSTQAATTLGLSHHAHASNAAPLAAGTVTEYSIPTFKSQPVGITSGPDGNLWFTEGHGNKIGKVTSGGVFTEYALPTATSEPEGITSGPDGNLWFTEFDGNRIGKITTGGQITEYTLPNAKSEPEGITSGPCGDGMQAQCLWFTEYAIISNNRANIGRITTTGTITEYALLTEHARANDITLGPGGVLYFTEQINNSGMVPP